MSDVAWLLGSVAPQLFEQASAVHVVLGSGADLDDLAARIGSQGQALIRISADQGLADLDGALGQAVQLAGHRFEAIHLYGHAAAAELSIGRDRITGAGLAGHAQGLQQLAQALIPGGDLLLYGCDLAAGAKGHHFVQQLSALIGADVAASDDLTGQGRSAADWTLEVKVGDIQTQSQWAEQLGWQGTLSQLQEPIRLQSVKVQNTDGSESGLLDVTLRAHRGAQQIELADPENPLAPGTLTLVDGFMTYAWEVHTGTTSTGVLSGDHEQGPTLQVNPGDTLRIRLENELGDQDTNLHTHGLVIEPSGNADNVLISVPPGYANVYEYKIPADQEPGVNWYHPHRHEHTAEQVYRGLAGFLVIGDGNNDIDQIKDLPFRMMMIQAQTIGRDANGKPVLKMLENVDDTTDSKGQVKSGNHFQMTLNGQYMPDIAFAGLYEAWVQLQINPRDLVRTFMPNATGDGVGAAAMKGWNFAALDNVKTYYAAQDGEAFPSTVGKTRVNLEPGGSDDVALSLLRDRKGGFATALAPGKRVTEIMTAPPEGHQHYFAATVIQPGKQITDANGKTTPRQVTLPLARLAGYQQGGDQNAWDNRSLTSKTMQYEDLSSQHVDVVREITFESKANKSGQLEFMINGKIYPNGPVIQPRAGQVEEWRVYNKDAVPHPIHLHMQSFQAEGVSIGRNGYTIPPHYYDSDVWYMDPKSINVFRIKWRPTLGESVYHCHNLIHEDGGMMAALNVIPEQPLLAVAEAAGNGMIGFYPLAAGAGDAILPTPAQIISPFDTFADGPDFKPIPYTAGLSVAMGDVDSDGIPDAVVAQKVGGAVIVLSGKKKFTAGFGADSVLNKYYPFGQNPGFPINVVTADVTGDTYADVIVAGGDGADGQVKVYSGATGQLISAFKAVDQPGYRGGVSLATGNVDGSGRERILTAPASGAAPQISVWGWDLFTKLPLASGAAALDPSITPTADHQHDQNPLTPAAGSGLLGDPQLIARVLAGPAKDLRGLSLATTYYGAANGGYRRIVSAPSTGADRATLWTLEVSHAGHSGENTVAKPPRLVRLTDFRPRTGKSAKGFSLASVSTTTGSVVALAPRGGDGTMALFSPARARGWTARETQFKPIDQRSLETKLQPQFVGPLSVAGS